ncbi:helix-turn-helix domain-containing protein [Streptomyces sp. NBC_00989]|uniref:helix-turn-helix domain-containing protein n=1 Tax=Streptomyces sp. NBC_00989 TaxID=2903705 RepID=UPI00386A1D0F|nr:helix-turn-helix transcriptional regulator [Streptomyces sp. NBC_00989]WSW98139.1 helix-turn-helix transcriptional regulator [Streptomyces sp. NBC_00989]
MGRRENPIASCERELEKLALYLRDHRERAGLNYRELAVRSGCSASTLIRAVAGEQMPKLKTVRAYALACDADPDEAERLWKRARYRAARGCQEPVPHPRYVRNFAELHVALADLYQKDGARPYRELEAASAGVLAHATVGRFLRQEGGRPTRQFVRAFAIACGAKGLVLREWEQAWDRAEERRLGPAVVARRQASGVVLPDGRPVYLHSDPERTPDGQELRRFTLPDGTTVLSARSKPCPVCTSTTMQPFTQVSRQLMQRFAVAELLPTPEGPGPDPATARRAPSRLVIKARAALGHGPDSDPTGTRRP